MTTPAALLLTVTFLAVCSFVLLSVSAAIEFVTGGRVLDGLVHAAAIRTLVRQMQVWRGRTSVCVIASGRAEGVPEAPALLTPTAPERLCPNTRQHWVDVTQEHHMPEHYRTGRASLRLADPDERVSVDPFAAPAFRFRRPGRLLRAVAGTEREPNPVREKPS